MKKMVLIEIKHCIDRAEYKVVFIALMILNIASYILCVKNDIGKSYQFIRSANENFVLQGTEAAYIPYIMYLLLPVYATIIASLSLIREEKSNSSILLIQRIGKKKYLAGKLFGILIVTFLTITIPMLINLLLCHLTYPIHGYDSAWGEPDYAIGLVSYNADNFLDMVRLQHPTLYNLIYIFNYGIFGSGLAILAYALSYYNKMKVLYFAKIPGALFIFYIVFNLIVSVFGLNEFSIQGYIMPNVHGNIIREIVLILLIFGLSIGIIQRKIKNYEVI